MFANVIICFVLSSGVHLLVCVVCVVLMRCSGCWPFVHYILRAALFYRCSCFL